MSTMTAREDLTYEEQTGWDLAIASMRARHINAYSADDGGIIVALRTDDEDWRNIWLSHDAAEQLAGMLHLLTKG